MMGEKGTDPVVEALGELQRLVRAEEELAVEDAARHVAIPEDLAKPGAVSLDLSVEEVETFRRVKAAIEADLRFEHLGGRIADPLEGFLTRFVCLCAVETDHDHVSDFIAEHQQNPGERLCYLGVEFLKVEEPLDLFGLELLPTHHEKIPDSTRWFSVAKPVESVIAVPVPGTHLTLMKDRAAAIAERALRALRIALAGSVGGGPRQLRFRLSESYSFGDLLGGWQTRPDARWSLPLDSGLLERAASTPIAGLAREPTNDLERHAARAMAWIEDSMIDGDQLRSLLFSFFALEAMLGDSSEGLKANGLAYRRALLSHATRGSFPDPDQVYLLYDRVRSAAVHGEDPPLVSERDHETFVGDVREALSEYLDLAAEGGFKKRSRVLRHLREHPDRTQLDEWLAEFGDRGWERFLSAGQTLDDQEAAAVAKALSHPVRLGFLRALGELERGCSLSPVEYARASGKTPDRVAYHVRVLTGARVVNRVPQRGTREHRYTLSDPQGRLAVSAIKVLAGSGR